MRKIGLQLGGSKVSLPLPPSFSPSLLSSDCLHFCSLELKCYAYQKAQKLVKADKNNKICICLDEFKIKESIYQMLHEVGKIVGNQEKAEICGYSFGSFFANKKVCVPSGNCEKQEWSLKLTEILSANTFMLWMIWNLQDHFKLLNDSCTNLNMLSLRNTEELTRCHNTGKKKILLKREERNSGKLKSEFSQSDIDILENSVSIIKHWCISVLKIMW